MTLDEFLALMIFSLLCLVWVWLNFEFTEDLDQRTAALLQNTE